MVPIYPASQHARVEDIARFLERYRRFEALWAENRLTQFKRSFAQLRSAVTSLQAMADEVARVQAPRFNIFRLLGAEADEDCTHTPFLADLFNPKGSHAQGTLFLRELFKHCSTKAGFPMPEGDIDSATWFVESQKATPFGILDLVVTSPALRYLLVIENKVYAWEQSQQLSRYYQWMETRKHLYDKRALLFLTPEGAEPTSAGGYVCFCLSYKDGISAILQRALSQTQASSVRETILQYLAIIRNF